MHVLRPLEYKRKGSQGAIYPAGNPTAGQFQIEKPKASLEKQGKTGQDFGKAL